MLWSISLILYFLLRANFKVIFLLAKESGDLENSVIVTVFRSLDELPKIILGVFVCADVLGTFNRFSS